MLRPKVSRSKLADVELGIPSIKTHGSPWVFVRFVAAALGRLHHVVDMGLSYRF
jgi:hypothetical protein